MTPPIFTSLGFGFGYVLTTTEEYVEDIFSTYVYTGNGSSQTITNGIDLNGEGGLVWVKKRSGSQNHRLQDTVQGITKSGISNITSAYETSATRVTSVSSTGFSVGNDSDVNENTSTYASWTFRKTPGFFDVVTYTGNGVAGRTVAHNLGSVPGCIIVKRTDTTGNWVVYHRSLGNSNTINLQSTGASFSSPLFNNTTPTNTEFTLNNGGDVNGNGGTYVAYLFAHDDAQFGTNEDESIIKCGSFTESGSGAAVTLGWEPQWLLIKRFSNTGDWILLDTMRLMTSSGANGLYPNLSSAESATAAISPTSTGFAYGAGNLGNGDYIYIAIRRGLMKTPTDATDVFAADKEVSPTYSKTFTSGFPVDLTVTTLTSATSSKYWLNRVTGTSDRLVSDSTAAAFTGQDNGDFDRMDGWYENIGIAGDAISWMFRRAPGFFDIVAYTGTGSATTVTHNLAVVPELMIIKKRNGAIGWAVYHQALGASAYLFLHGDSSEGASSTFFNATTPTASSFSVGTSTYTNASSDTYIAYLFASLAGISKVGSYTGTGSTLDVNCGFTAGARFVLIKRADSTGDWYVWDSTRGIVSGNDPYLLLNSTAAEVTSTDYIDPLNSGFTVTSSAPAAINALNGEYIFLAIA